MQATQEGLATISLNSYTILVQTISWKLNKI
jgi:hypothetical protein